MHKAIFSANERKIIEEYLETGTELKGFRVLKHRVPKYTPQIINDYQLMKRLQARFALELLQDKEGPE